MRYLLPLALALGACCPNTPLTPNGRDRVLSFESEFTALADGMETELFLPAAISQGGGKLDPCPRRTRSWEFDGTRLETQTGGALEVLSTSHDAAGFRVRVRCNAPPGGSDDSLVVRVLAGSDVRYSDAYPIFCDTPGEARFEVLPAGAPQVFLVGAHFALQPILQGSYGARLGGSGFRGDDGGVLRVEQERERPYLATTALKPGRRPKLHAGATLVEAPIDVVGPEDVARIDFTVTPLNPGDPSRTVVAIPKDRQGRAIGTNACTWTTPGGTSRLVASSSDYCATYVEPAAGVKQICAKVGNASGCTAL